MEILLYRDERFLYPEKYEIKNITGPCNLIYI